jgi:hypothetical protein
MVEFLLDGPLEIMFLTLPRFCFFLVTIHTDQKNRTNHAKINYYGELDKLGFQVISFPHRKISVIPGVAKRRPEIQEAVWSHWIALKSFTSCPAFAGMTQKNINIEVKEKYR